MTEASSVNLQFEDSGNWYSLPEWADYFISIGRQAALLPKTGSRVVAAIVVPTRAFGAAFVALGMVINDAALRNGLSEASHFEMLFDLPVGTPVLYRPDAGKVLKGVLQGPRDIDGQLRISVQVQSGGMTYLIPEAGCLRVQPTGGRAWKLPKKQGPHSVRPAERFVDSLLGKTGAQLGLRPKPACALVGRRNLLEHEIRRTPLSIHVNGDPRAEGHLQDVIRVDSFLADQQPNRSILIAVSADQPSNDAISKVEIGIVFDGALGFLKWGGAWPCHHQVVILDRTEPYFDDAVSAINTRFSQNRMRDGGALLEGHALPGGEILAFREALP